MATQEVDSSASSADKPSTSSADVSPAFNITEYSVIVVDDEKTVRRVLHGHLKKMGFSRVDMASSGEEGLSLISKDRYDLILLDVFMPGMDGLELLRILKQASASDSTIVMMTASDDPDTLRMAYSAGADDFLQKPIRPDYLRMRLVSLLEERKRRNDERALREKLEVAVAESKELQEQIRLREKELSLLFQPNVARVIETPIELVRETISDILRGNHSTEEYRTALFAVARSLGSDLYRPAFVRNFFEMGPDSSVAPNSKEEQYSVRDSSSSSFYQKELRTWLLDQYTSVKPRDLIQDRKDSSSSSSHSEGSEEGDIDDHPHSHWMNSLRRRKSVPPDLSVSGVPVEVESLCDIGLNVSSVGELCMQASVPGMFEVLGLVNLFNLDLDRLQNFLVDLRMHYLPNPYHCFLHAMDVTQFVFSILALDSVKCLLTDMECLCLLSAAMGHDVEHNGKNNNFHINSQSPLALEYNDISVLENHHARTMFSFLSDDKLNFVRSLAPEQFRDFRRGVIDAILCTDMAKHFEFVSKLQTRLNSGTPLCSDSADDRKLVFNVIMKCSDICNQARPFDVAREWSFRVVTEFFLQGDAELAQGLPISPMMDRKSTDALKMQCNFIDFVVRPLFDLLAKAFNREPTIQRLICNLSKNRRIWGAIAESFTGTVEDTLEALRSASLPDEVMERITSEEDAKFAKIIAEISSNMDGVPSPERRYSSKIVAESIVDSSEKSSSIVEDVQA